MDITKLAAKPQLMKVIIDNEKIVEKYGEEIVFYTWDRQPLEVFMQLVSISEGESSTTDMLQSAKHLILDEDGKPVITEDTTIPNDVLILAATAVVHRLGEL